MTRVDKDYHKRIILKQRNEKILKINHFIGHYFLTFINFAIQNIFLQNIVLVPMDCCKYCVVTQKETLKQ